MNKWVMVLLAVLVAGGYWGYDAYARRSESTLLLRAHDFWEAVRTNDLVTAYQMETEAAIGTLAPHEVEQRRDWGVRVVGYQLGQASIDGEHAEIDLTLELTRPNSETKTKSYPGRKDMWTFVGGQWHHGLPQAGTSMMRHQGPPTPQGAPWNPLSSDR